TLDVTRHSNTSGFDLTVRNIRRRDRLDAVLAERHRRATGRVTCAPGVVLLAELDLTGNQHGYASTPAAATGAASALGAALAAPAPAPAPRRGRSSRRSSRRSGRDDFWLACSRASSLLVMSPL